MPHQAGEGYTALKQWVDENLQLILNNAVPFDFGNFEAQRVADQQLVKDLRQAGVSGDVLRQIENLPPVPFPKGEEPAFAAQRSKSVFGQIYDTLKEVGEKFVSGVRRLFGF